MSPRLMQSSVTTTCAVRIGSDEVRVQAWRSCTEATSCSSRRWRRTSSRSMSSGVASKRMRSAGRSNCRAALSIRATTAKDAMESAREKPEVTITIPAATVPMNP